jgi:hypothetical protein
MLSDQRLGIVRQANENRAQWQSTKRSFSKEGYDLGMWATARDHGDLSEKSDEELKKMISLHFGFADDEEIDPTKVIKSPDHLVVGREYFLASNGYPLGKYVRPISGGCNAKGCRECKSTDLAWTFDNGTKYGDTRGPIIWEIGIFSTSTGI